LYCLDRTHISTRFASDWPLPEMSKHQNPDAPRHTPLADLQSSLRQTLPSASAKARIAPDRLNAYLEEWNSELGKEMLFQHIRLLDSTYMNSISSNLAHLGKPVMLVWGEADSVTPVSIAQRLHAEIPESELEIVPGASHLLLEDAPGAVIDAIVNWHRE